MSRSRTRAEDGVLYVPGETPDTVLLDSPAWYAWLEQHTSFAFVDPRGTITVRKQRGGGYWTGYRRQAGRVHAVYLGRSGQLSLARLRAAAQTLGGLPPASAPITVPPVSVPSVPSALAALAQTKFFMPPLRPQRVPRTRLLDRLRADPLPPVILVAAPAGCGKTTLVVDWITADRRRAAWLTLDTGDNDPLSFWAALATALATVQPGVSTQVLASLRRPQPPPLTTVVALLINEWTTHLQPDAEGRPVLLVLDDYHMITQRAIHETVLTLIERLPPQLRLVLTSRIDPPLRLAHLRVRAAILEIRAASLLFNGAEVAAFLTGTMGLALPAPAASLLATRTEGWVAALQLAALSLRHQPDPEAFLATFDGSHRHLLTYLVDEVLSRQTVVLQEFLLATAVLDRLCAELCAAVISDAPSDSPVERPPIAPPGSAPREAVLQAQALLEDLNIANLFLIPLDASGRWYRYHTLFAETLRHRLRQRDPGAERTYRRRASAWYKQAGYGPEAIQQALAAQDWDTAAGLIEHFADDVRRRGELGTFDTWLSALPPALVRRRPGLGFWQAVRLMTNGQFSAGEAVLTEVEHDLAHHTAAPNAPGSRPATVDPLRGRTAALRAIMDQLFHGDPARTDAQARAALDQLPPEDREWRALALVSLAAATYSTDELDSTWQHYQAAIALSDQASYYFLAFLARSRAGALLCDRGELRAAHAYGAAARQLAAAWGVLDLPPAGHLDWLEARLRYEANDLPGAEQLARRSISLASQGRLIELEGYAHLTRCQICLAQGDPAGAQAALDLATARLMPAPADDAPDNAALRIALDAWREIIKLAQFQPGGGLPLGAPRDSPAARPALPLAHWIWRPAHLLPARTRLLLGDPAGALACLEPLCTHAAAGGAQALLIAALALEAIVLQDLGRRAAARTALLHALTLGAAEGYTRAILDAGPPIGGLLRTLAQELARSAETNPAFLAYVYRLRDAVEREPPMHPELPRLDVGSPAAAAAAAGLGAPPSLAPPPPSPPVAVLTSRELAILRLLAAGCSNQEIADQLIIGVNTVKWYLRTIYDKLDSTNRTQAVARARAFGLLR